MPIGLMLLAVPLLAAEPTAKKSPEEYIPVIRGIIAETDPFLAQLQEVEQRYKTPRAVRKLAPERARLRSAIESRLTQFGILENELSDRRREDTTSKGIQALAQLMSGVIPKNGADLINDLQTSIDIEREFRVWRDQANNRLEMEKAAFNMASRVALIQEVLALIVVLLLLSLAIAVVFGVKTARAKAKLETNISELAASSGDIDFGVGTPGQPRNRVGSAATVLGGNYVVDRELGRGGMGIVYEATDLSLRRKVAIKKLRQEIQEQLKDLEVLLNEARLVAKLKHPNIVEIHSIFKEKGQVYLVFEHVAGRTLHDVLQDRAKLSLRQSRTLIHQIGSALDYAHGQKVIHRDLKPANVMLTTEGIAKVMDFGIAHQAKVTIARMTQARAWGTPPYMAPEQETGSMSRESDLYAMGVLIYEMATGKLPFNGPNFLAQKNGMMYVEPSKIDPSLPAALDGLIRKALQPEPSARFHSAAEMSAAMDAIPDPAAA